MSSAFEKKPQHTSQRWAGKPIANDVWVNPKYDLDHKREISIVYDPRVLKRLEESALYDPHGETDGQALRITLAAFEHLIHHEDVPAPEYPEEII